jgi:hypothetical protein
MKTLLITLCLLLGHCGYAQIADNFDDSDLTTAPLWEGQSNSFLTIQKQLRSNSNTLNTSFYISTSTHQQKLEEWRLDTRLLLNTSSLNYVDFVLMADSFNLLKMKNGYFVRMGGTTDEVSLYKTKNGVETKLIDGIDNVLNTSINEWTLQIRRLKNHAFVLQRMPLLSGTLISEGIAEDSDFLTASYMGLRIKQSTASFLNKHFFDNLYAGQLIRDSIAPLVDSFALTGPNQLRCHFNEPCDSGALVDVLNYTVTATNEHPKSIYTDKNNWVVLNFQYPFIPNVTQYLKVEKVKDTSGNAMQNHIQSFYYSKPDTASWHQLLMTELMVDPNPPVGLPDKEYIEITNHSKQFLQLKGCNVHDASGPKPLPDTILPPDSIVVLYTIPSLNNAGDRVWLTNQNGLVIHEINYTDTWYRDSKKQNGGWSLEMLNPNNVCAGNTNWMGSSDSKGGTPGMPNSAFKLGLVDQQVPQLLKAWAINDSVIYLSFDEEIDSINSNQFTLLKDGKICAVKIQKYVNLYNGMEWLINFKPSADSTYHFEFSGIKDCAGNAIVNAQFELQWPSMANKNELILNELLFNPKSGGYDFIELYNNSAKALDLSKHFVAVLDEQNQYKSIEKLSSTPLILKPHQYLLLSQNNNKICMTYGCTNLDALYHDFNKMPSMPDDIGNLLLVNLKGQVIDSIAYDEDWHYPLLSDKEGVSLERISFTNTARTSDNWHSAASVVGFATPGYLNSQSVGVHGAGQYFTLQNKTVSPDDDGFEDVLILKYQLPKPDYATTIKIYDMAGRLIQDWTNNATLGTQGFVSWNGTDYNQQKAAIGLYIVMIESIHPSGDRIKEKISCVVAGKF